MSSPHRKLPFVVRRGRVMRVWVAALLLSLLGQLLLPVQAHTRWHIDERGRLVELCTLHGLQKVRIDPDSGAPLPVAPDPGYSPAMAFSGLLSHAAVPTLAVLPARFGRYLRSVSRRTERTPASPALPDAAIRGPPAALA
jgi:hypothetical protein